MCLCLNRGIQGNLGPSGVPSLPDAQFKSYQKNYFLFIFRKKFLTMIGLEKTANFSLASSFEIVSQLEETFVNINSVLWNGDSDGKVFYDIKKLSIG
jgi:hypothetical protein